MEAALYKKLMLGNFSRILLQNKPDGVKEFDGLPFDTVPDGEYDLLLAFVFDLDEMKSVIDQTVRSNLLTRAGYLYFAYPKKGNNQYTKHIDRDAIFPHLGIDEETGFIPGTALKFSKMVSLNDVFTVVGLKKDSVQIGKRAGNSNRVDDYVEKIPELRARLEERPEVLALYDGLTAGYQKDWARYVYGAKAETTQEKHLMEMVDILLAGYKSKALFQQRKRTQTNDHDA